MIVQSVLFSVPGHPPHISRFECMLTHSKFSPTELTVIFQVSNGFRHALYLISTNQSSSPSAEHVSRALLNSLFMALSCLLLVDPPEASLCRGAKSQLHGFDRKKTTHAWQVPTSPSALHVNPAAQATLGWSWKKASVVSQAAPIPTKITNQSHNSQRRSSHGSSPPQKPSVPQKS
jgi:hypothetical protein